MARQKQVARKSPSASTGGKIPMKMVRKSAPTNAGVSKPVCAQQLSLAFRPPQPPSRRCSFSTFDVCVVLSCVVCCVLRVVCCLVLCCGVLYRLVLSLLAASLSSRYGSIARNSQVSKVHRLVDSKASFSKTGERDCQRVQR